MNPVHSIVWECQDSLSSLRLKSHKLWYYDDVPIVGCPSECLSLLTNCP